MCDFVIAGGVMYGPNIKGGMYMSAINHPMNYEEPKEDMTKRSVTILLPDDTYRSLKVYAIAYDITIQEVVSKAIDKYIQIETKDKK